MNTERLVMEIAQEIAAEFEQKIAENGGRGINPADIARCILLRLDALDLCIMPKEPTVDMVIANLSMTNAPFDAVPVIEEKYRAMVRAGALSLLPLPQRI
ncbi:hypothetical protein [Rhodoligotrophos defluvii]|uniref:hypothetical protein n=1 Tax=Rhodoligotrophos defluvii TaxID=2561934 RepID=UPI0010C96EF1|nr:hypothetical protein [Rhodoligotrophos defluvii]